MPISIVALGLKDIDGDGFDEHVWRLDSTEGSDISIDWDVDGSESGTVTVYANASTFLATESTTGTLSILEGAFLHGSQTASGGNYIKSIFGTGDDVAYGMDGGEDYIQGGKDNDYIRGLAGDDHLEGDGNDDTLEGGNGNDSLLGDSGSDVLYGDAGDDMVEGGNGADTLYGGAGNDTLIGGGSSDAFVIDVDAGTADTITDFNENNETIDISAFAGIDELADLNLTQVGSDVTADLGGGQTLVIESINVGDLDESHFIGLTPPPPLPPAFDITAEAIGTADVDGDGFDEHVWRIDSGEVGDLNVTWDIDGGENGAFTLVAGATHFLYTETTTGTFRVYESAAEQVSVSGGGVASFPYNLNTSVSLWYGSEGDDNITSGNSDRALYGQGGDDTIASSGGDDTISGGDGNDSITGVNGTDLINGDAGDDTIDGGSKNDTIDGGSGNDVIAGGNNSDSITDGTGSDTLSGGNHTDSFIITQGAGDADVITDFATGSEQVDLSAFANLTYWSDLDATQVASDVLLDLGNGQTLTLEGVSLGSINHTHFIGIAEDPPGVNLVGTDNQPAVWEMQWYAATPEEFQYADTDNDGTLEFYGLYGGVLWEYDFDTNGWERQWFAGENIDKFQFVNVDGDSNLEFYGLYDGNLWEYDSSWTFTFHAPMQDFYYANNDGDSNVELFTMNQIGQIWEFDAGDGGWSIRWEYYNQTVDDFQIVDIDQDGTVDYTYVGGGLLQAFEVGQGWTLYPELSLPSIYQVADIDNDGTNEFAGVYGTQLWQQEFSQGDGVDTLTGGAGFDTINGGSGHDVLTGNGGNDRFEFAGSVGLDSVTDYVDGSDMLAFSVSGFATAADIVAATSYTASDAIIDLGAAGQVTLEGVTSGIDVSDIVIF